MQPLVTVHSALMGLRVWGKCLCSVCVPAGMYNQTTQEKPLDFLLLISQFMCFKFTESHQICMLDDCCVHSRRRSFHCWHFVSLCARRGWAKVDKQAFKVHNHLLLDFHPGCVLRSALSQYRMSTFGFVRISICMCLNFKEPPVTWFNIWDTQQLKSGKGN